MNKKIKISIKRTGLTGLILLSTMATARSDSGSSPSAAQIASLTQPENYSDNFNGRPASAPAPTIKQGNTAETHFITLPVNKAAVMKLPKASRDVVVANPAMLDVVVRNPREVYLFAKAPGQTNAFFFDDTGKQIVNLEVNVGWDTKVIERIFKEQMPGARIKVETMSDTIILSGTVKNAAHAKIAKDISERVTGDPTKVINNIGITGQEQVTIKVKVSEIQRTILKQLGIDWNTAFQFGSFAGGLGLVNGFGSNGIPATGLVGSGLNSGNIVSKSIGALPAFASAESAASYLSGLQNDVSYLQTLTSQARSQIGSLQEKALETGAATGPLNTLINQLNNDISTWEGEIAAKNNTILDVQNTLSNTTSVDDNTAQLRSRTLGYTGKNVAADSLLKALERHSLVKTLAEPNLTALSGESAKFLAGGEIPYIVSQTFGQASVDYKPYGIGLAFTPTVLNEGRISLKISTEVSDISSENVVAANSSYPGISVRRAETTVELPSGGSIVMAGLIRDDTRRSIDSAPGIKEVPVLGALFRSNDFKNGESELVIIATPYLVGPTHEKNLRLPTDGYADPSDIDMYLRGRVAAVHDGKIEPKVPDTEATKEPTELGSDQNGYITE